jgi:hypothetical protein
VCTAGAIVMWQSYLGASSGGVGHTHGAFRGFFSDATHCDDNVMGMFW